MTTVCYARVSTEEQSLKRQIESCSEYAHFDLGIEIADLDAYRDQSTGRNTERSGYRKMMQRVEKGEIDNVVVSSVSRISRSIRDLERTVDRLKDADTALHVVSEGLVMDPKESDPYQAALFRMLGVFAQLESDMTQARVKDGIASRQKEDGYHHGRPPLGFDKEDGYLIETDDYDRICVVLELVQKGELSKRKAARELNTSRSTISRALERGELYGL